MFGAIAEAETNTNRPQNRTLMSHTGHGHIFYAMIPYKYPGDRHGGLGGEFEEI